VGDGDALVEGDLVNYALSVFDAASGEKIEDAGFGDDPLLPVTLTVGTGADTFFGCATTGSRVAMAVPAQQSVEASVWVLDILGTTPLAAWGEPQTPEAGFPTVELADDGVPTVTIPEGTAPADLQISVLKKGDGATVAGGDTTLLQYYGVDWDTGESFDDSWSKGAPYSNEGNQYVPGFVAALEGQTVGSQVLVVIPPALGYGEAGSSDHELAGKTLVFVIDILATQHPLAQ
jgi:peptidylprolyl isomerase